MKIIQEIFIFLITISLLITHVNAQETTQEEINKILSDLSLKSAETASSYFMEKIFEEFEKIIKKDVKNLNKNQKLKELFFAKYKIIDKGAEVEVYLEDGTIKTKGQGTVNFKINNFPGSTVQEDGSLVLADGSIVANAGIQLITKENQGFDKKEIILSGGSVDTTNSKGRVFIRFKDGSKMILGKRIFLNVDYATSYDDYGNELPGELKIFSERDASIKDKDTEEMLYKIKRLVYLKKDSPDFITSELDVYSKNEPYLLISSDSSMGNFYYREINSDNYDKDESKKVSSPIVLDGIITRVKDQKEKSNKNEMLIIDSSQTAFDPRLNIVVKQNNLAFLKYVVKKNDRAKILKFRDFSNVLLKLEGVDGPKVFGADALEVFLEHKIGDDSFFYPEDGSIISARKEKPWFDLGRSLTKKDLELIEKFKVVNERLKELEKVRVLIVRDDYSGPLRSTSADIKKMKEAFTSIGLKEEQVKAPDYDKGIPEEIKSFISETSRANKIPILIIEGHGYRKEGRYSTDIMTQEVLSDSISNMKGGIVALLTCYSGLGCQYLAQNNKDNIYISTTSSSQTGQGVPPTPWEELNKPDVDEELDKPSGDPTPNSYFIKRFGNIPNPFGALPLTYFLNADKLLPQFDVNKNKIFEINERLSATREASMKIEFNEPIVLLPER